MRVFTVVVAVTLAATVVSAQDRSQGQPAASAEDVVTGETLFGTSCGFCHQAGGRAAGRGPKLAGTDRPDEYLLNRIRVGKEGAMPAYGRAFTDKQLRAIVAYIRSLKDDSK
jgi:mono/diheme cytochrome c family protein